MSDYQPEIGQLCFGQPFQHFEGSDLLAAAIYFVRREIDVVLWNRMQRNADNPFDNTGATFETEGLQIHAYSWDDRAEQPWNMKIGELEISWYKHSMRGLSVNREMAPTDVEAMLAEALNILRKCDVDHHHSGEKGEQPFVYNGEWVGESFFQRARREERQSRAQ